ncbi:MAG TPA: MerR family transcriptional regulator [Nocardia sp.]|uniref:MerR family transcriptional regulator n=1 Tax=Nocardia TaxID=1817 RepID=UPI0024549830|nr:MULTISPECIES: MerR family transcriptional regulator [Nocardia]HLS79505.1 MerR family transcriptional regulator [Nocardia sp.]
MIEGVTIGRAAAFAGVTVKTVRHYHKQGLIAEPPRDGSGYRRYRSADLFRLVQVRTLAAAGVPLAEIGPLLDADPADFAAALVDVERQLTERIAELTARRATLRRLAQGDRALLPERALTLLERMRELGFTPEHVAASREGMVLAKALVPDGFDDYLTNVELALEDTRFVELNRQVLAAAAGDPRDPGLVELADRLADCYLANPALLRIVTAFRAPTETGTRYRLIRDYAEQPDSATARLTALLEARLRAAGIDIPGRDSP